MKFHPQSHQDTPLARRVLTLRFHESRELRFRAQQRAEVRFLPRRVPRTGDLFTQLRDVVAH